MALERKWDIKIAGNPYMLARATSPDREGKIRPIFEEQQVQYPASRQASGAQGYANWPENIEGTWVLRDLSGGFGKKFYTGTNQYYYGFVDARRPGEVILPPELNSQAVTAEDRIHAEFQRSISGTDNQFICSGRYVQYWTDPTSVSNSLDLGTGRAARSAANFQGSHDTLLTFVADEVLNAMPQPYRTFTGASATTTWGQDDQDQDVTPTSAKFYDDTASTYATDVAAPIALTLNGMTSSDYIYVGDIQPFEGVEFDINDVNSNAATMTIEFYNGSSWAAVASLSDGTASGGATLAQDGDCTYTLPTTWKPIVVDGVTLYWIRISVSTTLDAAVSTTDIDLIQRDTALLFAEHDSNLYRVVKTAHGYQLWSTANGSTNATWSLVGTITHLGNPVTNMASVGTRLMIVAEDGLYVLADDGSSIAREVWPHPRDLSDTNNGIGAGVWRGQWWCPSRFGFYSFADAEGYIRIDTSPNPGNLVENNSPVSGKITCFAGDDFYGYAVIRNDKDSKSYLMSYIEETNSWHSLLELGDITSRKMWVSDIGHATNPLLYFNAGDDLRWIVLPRNSPSPSQDSACRFDRNTTNVGVIYLSRFTSNYEFENKTWLTGKRLLEDASSTETDKAEYRTTDDGGWTTLDTFDTDPVDEKSFSTNVSGRILEMRDTIASSGNTATPIIRAFFVSYAVRFPFKRRFIIQVGLSFPQSQRGGARSDKRVKTFKNALKTSMSSGAPIEFVHLDSEETLDVVPTDYRVFTLDATDRREIEYVGYAELVEHQAVVFGIHERLANYTHAQLAAFTHDEITTL